MGKVKLERAMLISLIRGFNQFPFIIDAYIAKALAGFRHIRKRLHLDSRRGNENFTEKTEMYPLFRMVLF